MAGGEGVWRGVGWGWEVRQRKAERLGLELKGLATAVVAYRVRSGVAIN